MCFKLSLISSENRVKPAEFEACALAWPSLPANPVGDNVGMSNSKLAEGTSVASATSPGRRLDGTSLVIMLPAVASILKR
mmetsp:Transcript_27009/g.32891  ORF Transcript_27009/g.32891 Transcript_27009/m.32891 type:complete len:80 (-) Transcript_27009:494-733(-)